MKRLTLITLAAALVLGGAATAGPGRPWLRLVETDPLTVRGGNFDGGDQITITATARQQAKLVRASRQARATSEGTFTVVLRGFDAPNCGPWGVVARGSSGAHAAIKIMPQCGALPIGRG